MNKIVAVLLLGLGIASAQAAPITFTSSGYTTFAFADVDGVSDGPITANAPPDPLPIASSASVTEILGSATADASADSLSLAASTSASSTGGVASGSAVSTFLGEFTTPGGPMSLFVDFDSDTAGSTLDILWFVNGISLPVTGSGLFSSGDFAAGLTGTLEIVLISTSSADVTGATASNASTAAFRLNSVPEPATLALVLGGLGLLGAGRFGGRQTGV